MLSIQYGFDLPEDFDVDGLLQRIPEIGAKFDHLAGMHLKVFLLDRRSAAVPVHYSPFYLWHTEEAMLGFLTSDLFRGVIGRYGRPSVRRWVSLANLSGAGAEQPIRYAVQEVTDVPPDADTELACNTARERAQAAARQPGLHTAFAGLDTARWQLLHTTLWTTEPPASERGRRFEVPYVSAP